MRTPCILSIAGSDSGGGAGIQADVKTITAIGGFSLTVITVLTAQNSLEVAGIHAPDPPFIKLQLETVLKDFPVKAIKIGMLYSSEIMHIVSSILRNKGIPIVVDPVCVSQSSHSLLQPAAISVLCKEIIPLATVLTPNKPEAELLTNIKISNPEHIKNAGEKLLQMGTSSVLIKGGHFISSLKESSIDWFLQKNSPLKELPQPFIQTKNTHGTGCTLSSAIATFLGFNFPLEEAIVKAQTYLNHCLNFADNYGHGYGCPQHISWLTKKR